MGVHGAVVGAEDGVVFRAELGDVVELAGPAVEQGQAELGADEEGFLRVEALDVGRDRDPRQLALARLHIQGFRNRGVLVQADGVQLVLLDIDEPQAVGVFFVVGAFAQPAVLVHIPVRDRPGLLGGGGGHSV